MIRYITLAEYYWLAEQVTGVDAEVLAESSRSDLADSALHAPQAGFGEEEFYPEIYDKAAVLVCRLAWNHPLSMGTSGLHGRRWSCSLTSTTVHGIQIRLTLKNPKRRCWPSRPVRSTKPGHRAGFGRGFASVTGADVAGSGRRSQFELCLVRGGGLRETDLRRLVPDVPCLHADVFPTRVVDR